MVRTRSVDKNGMRKGAWSEEEDNKLRAYVLRYGHWNWRQLPKFAGLDRCGKSCRLRWLNYLKPGVKRGNYTAEEEEIILKLHGEFGKKWSVIASKLPGRTDNDIKNHWHTHLRRSKNQDSKSTKSTDHQETSERSHHMDDSDHNDISSSMSTFDSIGNGDQMGTDNITAVDHPYSEVSSSSYDSILDGDILGSWTVEDTSFSYDSALDGARLGWTAEDTYLIYDSTFLDGALQGWTAEDTSLGYDSTLLYETPQDWTPEDTTNPVEPTVETFDDESFWTQPFALDTSCNNNLQLQMPQLEEEIEFPFSPYIDQTGIYWSHQLMQ